MPRRFSGVNSRSLCAEPDVLQGCKILGLKCGSLLILLSIIGKQRLLLRNI